MLLSFTASLVETIVVKTTVFALNQSLNLVYYGGASIYNYYYPTMSETEKLQHQIKLLEGEVRVLKDRKYEEEMKDLSDNILLFDESEDFVVNS
tara:strand:- start:10946 stop:11227 length:282 start_codon:yes stop_codon:yes gene_type:complete